MNASEICQKLEELRTEGCGFEVLLEKAVELLHESSEKFDWTGVYELHADGILRLGPFVGSPTDHVFIAVGQGVCGTAVAEKRNLNIPDVAKASNYLACSAETRSELVVLIRDGDEIFAQIDIDSHEVGAFDEGLVSLVEQLAEWLSVAWPRTGVPATLGEAVAAD